MIDPSNTDIVRIPATTLELPVADMSVFESHEGMYVNIVAAGGGEDNIVFSEYYNFDRYGETVVCKARNRIFQFTERNVPDIDGYSAHVDEVERSCVIIDDNNGSQNPDPALLGGIAAYQIKDSFTFRGGDVVTNLKGPLLFSFDRWRVQPMSTDELSFTPSARPSLPALAEGDLKLAFANLLNYFTSYDGRGADNDEEFLRQSSKTSLALSMMDADIVAVCELENAGATAADDLAEKLNNRFSGGERVYSAATSDQGISMVGNDAIRVDVLFDTLKYEVLSSAMLTDDLVSQELLDESPSGTIFNGKSRVPLAVTFQDIDADKEFTVVVTHFKSKGDFSGDASGDDEDQGDGAAHYNPTRELSTIAVKEWLESSP